MQAMVQGSHGSHGNSEVLHTYMQATAHGSYGSYGNAEVLHTIQAPVHENHGSYGNQLGDIKSKHKTYKTRTWTNVAVLTLVVTDLNNGITGGGRGKGSHWRKEMESLLRLGRPLRKINCHNWRVTLITSSKVSQYVNIKLYSTTVDYRLL